MKHRIWDANQERDHGRDAAIRFTYILDKPSPPSPSTNLEGLTIYSFDDEQQRGRQDEQQGEEAAEQPTTTRRSGGRRLS